MKRKGFTLLEMIVVVMIMSVLFLLTIPNVSSVIASTKAKSCDILVKEVDSARVQYELDYGEPPNSVQDLISGNYLAENQGECANGTTIYFDGQGNATHD